MRTLASARLAIAGSLVAFGLVGAVAPTAPAVAGSASLSVSPNLYVGGQAVTMKGDLGVQGKRKIWLQYNLGRPGDSWTRVEGFHRSTARDGSFSFSYPAPSMFNILYRVASGVGATPAYTFNARSQDLVLTLSKNDSGLKDGQELAGQQFRIDVDTTPTLTHRPDLPPPPFPNRTLTLQKQVSNSRWVDTGLTTTTDNQGAGHFTPTVSAAGCVVYRVREEDVTTGANQIGWFPSFPTPVAVVANVTDPGSCPSPAPAPSKSYVPPSTTNTGATTAAGTYKWGQPLWDFAWEQGQSLTSPPSRGSDRKGEWIDATTGLGRAAPHNGGLMIDSQRNYDGPGDFGTTMVTMHGNARAHGRWEARMRFKRTEIGAGNYDAVIELVPSRTSDYDCGARNITVADVPIGGKSLIIGAKNVTQQWRANRSINVPEDAAVAFAVEVTAGHITWFYNGKPIGTVGSAAVSGVPLTMRLSLVGAQHNELNKTTFISDWQRGFDLHAGQHVTSGGSLRKGTFSGGC